MELAPENGNTQAETEGDGNNRDCVYMGNEMHGTAWGRGVMQGGGAVWAGAWAGEVAWMGGTWAGVWAGAWAGAGEAAWMAGAWVGVWAGALPWGLRTLDHWQQLIAHRALCVCQIALQLHMGRYWWHTYG